MTATRTPGKLYTVRQSPSKSKKRLPWIVIEVDTWQGERMREREEPHVYDTRAQAERVVKRLNLERGEMTNTDMEDIGRSLFYEMMDKEDR